MSPELVTGLTNKTVSDSNTMPYGSIRHTIRIWVGNNSSHNRHIHRNAIVISSNKCCTHICDCLPQTGLHYWCNNKFCTHQHTDTFNSMQFDDFVFYIERTTQTTEREPNTKKIEYYPHRHTHSQVPATLMRSNVYLLHASHCILHSKFVFFFVTLLYRLHFLAVGPAAAIRSTFNINCISFVLFSFR